MHKLLIEFLRNIVLGGSVNFLGLHLVLSESCGQGNHKLLCQATSFHNFKIHNRKKFQNRTLINFNFFVLQPTSDPSTWLRPTLVTTPVALLLQPDGVFLVTVRNTFCKLFIYKLKDRFSSNSNYSKFINSN